MKTEFAGFRMDMATPRDETWETIARSLAERGQVAYRVVRVVPPPPPRPAAASLPEGESRAQARRKTRLRSAKVLDEANRFLCEAVVQNRSADGFRLLLARNVALPARFGLHDDEAGELFTVSLAWRRGATVGLRILRRGPPAPMRGIELAALSGRYYGVGD